MRTNYPIDIPLDAITGFCKRNHIRKLSLFGSVLRDDFTPESDNRRPRGIRRGQDAGAEVLHDAVRT
jgi:hypothetical protein